MQQINIHSIIITELLEPYMHYTYTHMHTHIIIVMHIYASGDCTTLVKS